MNKQDSLITYLERVPDPRRAEGQRHNLSFILIIVIMSLMSGYIGYRAMGDFIEKNRMELLSYFKPSKNRLPSFDTIRRTLIKLDFNILNDLFKAWLEANSLLNGIDLISLDGKCIKGTLTHRHDSRQEFINVVTALGSESKLSLSSVSFNNGKSGIGGEMEAVRQLVKQLKIEGVTFTLDAYHCQKKR